MVKDKRNWKSAWWTHYHIDAKCLRSVPVLGIPEWDAEVERAAIDTLAVDYASLPKRHKETPDDLKRAESDAMDLMYTELAKLQS